jgi:hypothetical protein
VVTRGSTFENRANLAPKFLEQIERKYAGTRLGRQELQAEVLDDAPDALWTRAGLDQHRRKAGEIPALKRVVVSIDPAAKTNEVIEEGAATGIVVAGLGEDGRGYVLDDATCRASPNGWARRAIACYDRFDGDCVVGETNQGGDMVESTIRTVRPTVPFREVTATRGKWVRAEPVAALCEQGRVSHVGTFAELEDEMVLFGPNGMPDGASPDRLDALVWALTELFPQMTKKAPRQAAVQHESAARYSPHQGRYQPYAGRLAMGLMHQFRNAEVGALETHETMKRVSQRGSETPDETSKAFQALQARVAVLEKQMQAMLGSRELKAKPSDDDKKAKAAARLKAWRARKKASAS